MKRILRNFLVIGMLSAAAVSFGGCQRLADSAGSQDTETDSGSAALVSTSASTGSYREEALTLPENTNDVKAIREISGTVWMITDQAAYSSADAGSTWNISEEKTAWLSENRTIAAISPQGSFAFAGGQEIAVYHTDGTSQSIGIDFDGNACYTLEFADEDTLLVTDTESNIQIIDITSGTVIGEIPAEGEMHYLTAAFNGNILALTGEGVKFYDKKGEMQEGNEVVNRLLTQDLSDFSSSGKSGCFLQDSDGNGFSYASRRGIFHYTAGGSVTEQLLDGSTNTMGDNNSNFRKLAVLSDQSVLIAYIRENTAELKRYAAGGEQETTEKLTIYSLYENALLQQEINTYNQNNPDIVVSLEIGMTEGTGVTADDAIKTLNTEILAGTGPDLIILDGMDVEQSCESGLLADLSNVLRDVANEEGIYDNIVYTYETEGQVYAVPARFRIPILVGPEKNISQITDLSSLAEQVSALKAQYPKRASVVGRYDELLLDGLADFCSPSWLDESGEMDSKKLSEFLETAKRINDIQKEGISQADIEQTNADYDEDNAELWIPYQIERGETTLGIYTSKSLNFSLALLEVDLAFTSAKGQSSGVFVPVEIISVNAKSENQQAALAFVKEFLSSDCQKQFTIEDTAYPVNQTAFQEMREEEVARNVEYDTLPEEESRAGFEKIEEIIRELHTPTVTDTVIRETVTEQGVRYLSGEASLEETVNSILQKVNLHMAE
ncbi:MAG: ABC transporter substrate-binding protein [Eubacteriales bacterium]|nr:ABC transporter substrate-binding protein [Eubacteriales bacterium]